MRYLFINPAIHHAQLFVFSTTSQEHAWLTIYRRETAYMPAAATVRFIGAATMI